MDNLIPNFQEISDLIKKAQYNALKTLNKELINLYLHIGEYINKQVESSEWGKSVVDNLAVMNIL